MWVRSASQEDLETISKMLTETWHDTYDKIYGREKVAELTSNWHSVPALKQRLNKPRSEFIICDDGAEIGGMAYASQTDNETPCCISFMSGPIHRGKGLAKPC